ncbi:hypothetical protein BG006_003625 [Podila minutissima]|uniref:Fe2OG dioxygenase domain-containing protein n=1 Tax=Podila minutissima TaxID=64525 RepID=A0A9P5SM89_9FUNG|nr:hypothetical protein BG006_003625 [Podila minutissima]
MFSQSQSNTPILQDILTPEHSAFLAQTPPPPEPLNLTPLLANARKNEPIVALTVQHILSPAECLALIARAEHQGYDIALVNTGSGDGVHIPGYRDGQRCIIDDTHFAAQMWERIKPYLPAKYQGRPVVGLNERMRFLKYGPGDKFEAHMDGEYRRVDGSGHRTKMTVQLYLNDACEGGATTFLDEKAMWRVVDGVEQQELKVAVAPKVGQLLVFQHDLVHEGSVVKSGVKYVIRSDVLYGKPE